MSRYIMTQGMQYITHADMLTSEHLQQKHESELLQYANGRTPGLMNEGFH